MTITNLITGGLGFIGSNLSKRLLEKNEKVISLDNLSSGSKKNLNTLKFNDKFSFINHDILNPIELKNIDKIWHLASPASPTKYQINPIETSKINFIGSINALNLAKENKAKILLTSSSECYGHSKQFPQKESEGGFLSTSSKRSCYSQSKRIAETLFFDYERAYGLDVKVTRLFNIYGPNMDIKDGRVISNFFYQALYKKPLTIYGNGNQKRSFCFIDDAIDLLILIMESKLKGIINIGNNSEISINNLAYKINKIVGFNNKIIYRELPEDEPQRRLPALNRAKNEFNWYPKFSLDNGLSKTFEYYKKIILFN